MCDTAKDANYLCAGGVCTPSTAPGGVPLATCKAVCIPPPPPPPPPSYICVKSVCTLDPNGNGMNKTACGALCTPPTPAPPAPPDVSAGTLRWNVTVNSTECRLDNCVQMSPVISPDGKTVFAMFGMNTIYAFNTAGKNEIVWSTDTLMPNTDPSKTFVVTPLVLSPDGTTLYIVSDRLLAIDAANGKIKWTIEATGDWADSVQSSPVLSADGGTLYVFDGNPTIWSINTTNGTLIWAQTMQNECLAISNPALSPDESALYILCRGDYLALSARKTLDGTCLWDDLPGENCAFTCSDCGMEEGQAPTAPVVSHDNPIVYLGTGIVHAHPDPNGDYTDTVLFAVHASNGTQKWNFTSTVETNAPFSNAVSTPTVGADGTMVYIGMTTHDSQEGQVYAIHTGNGTVFWNQTVNASTYFTSLVPSHDGTALYYGSYGPSVNAINVQDGSEKWTFKNPAFNSFFSPTVSPDGTTVYVQTRNNALLAIHT